MPIPRPLREAEREVIQWMLRRAPAPFQYFLDHLDDVIVVGQCNCGCATVDLEVAKPGCGSKGKRIIGDFQYGPEDQPFGALLFVDNGGLSRLEFYSSSATPAPLPKPGELREFGQEFEPSGSRLPAIWSEA